MSTLAIRLPARVWTLALLDVTSAIGIAVLAGAPMGAGSPVALYAVIAGVLAGIAAMLLACGTRLSNGVLLWLAAVRAVVALMMIATAHSAGATLFSGAGLVWVAIWVTGFYTRRLQLMTLAAQFAGLLLAVAVNGHHVRTAVNGGALFGAAVILSMLLAQSLGSLRHEARHDHLTGLMNRYGLDEALIRLRLTATQAAVTSLVAIDLDGLKEVNDEGGHQAGDRMLVTFATELSAGARRTDLLARVGGDEFIAILPGVSTADATRWASEVQQRSSVTWSFGVAERRADEPLERWQGRADQNMYAAKSRTRTRPRATVAFG